jgi:hypothetical protein
MENLFGIIPDWLAGPIILMSFAWFTSWLMVMWRCTQKQSKGLFRFRRAFILYMQLEKDRMHEIHKNVPYNIQPIIDLLKDEQGRL